MTRFVGTRFAGLTLLALAACLASATANAQPYHRYYHHHYYHHHHVVVVHHDVVIRR